MTIATKCECGYNGYCNGRKECLKVLTTNKYRMTTLNITTESPESATLLIEILMELERAETKHPVFPSDPVYQVAIMAEESGEAVRAALQYTMEGGTYEDLKKELLQTAAMCIRVLKNLKQNHDNQTNRNITPDSN